MAKIEAHTSKIYPKLTYMVPNFRFSSLIKDIGDDRSSDAGVTMALDVETLLLVGNVDSEVSLDLITRSSVIPTK